MPLNADGSLRAWNAAEVAAMEIETIGVRDRSMAVESRRIDENVMTRPFFVKWSQRFNFMNLCLGDESLYTAGGVTKLSRLLPDSRFGRHTTQTQIAATHVEDVSPHPVPTEDADRFPTATKAKVVIAYAHARWDMRTDAASVIGGEITRFVSRSQMSRSQFQAFTLPGGAFKYTTAGGGIPHGTLVPQNVSFQRPIQRFDVTWHHLPYALYNTGALWTRLYAGTGDGIPWLGTVNDRALVNSDWGTYAGGTLLLEDVEERLYVSPLGASAHPDGLRWDITFKFAFAPRGWLSLFLFDPAIPGASGWYAVSCNGTFYTPLTIPDGQGLYNTRDFNALFHADIP
jgi:hypothetical protein